MSKIGPILSQVKGASLMPFVASGQELEIELTPLHSINRGCLAAILLDDDRWLTHILVAKFPEAVITQDLKQGQWEIFPLQRLKGKVVRVDGRPIDQGRLSQLFVPKWQSLKINFLLKRLPIAWTIKKIFVEQNLDLFVSEMGHKNKGHLQIQFLGSYIHSYFQLEKTALLIWLQHRGRFPVLVPDDNCFEIDFESAQQSWNHLIRYYGKRRLHLLPQNQGQMEAYQLWTLRAIGWLEATQMTQKYGKCSQWLKESSLENQANHQGNSISEP